jgi:transcriptional regulator with XRE-family HTH domain
MNMTVQEEMTVFCGNVKRLREREGLTRKKMAVRLGIGVETLNRLERGEIPPRFSVAVVCRISREFGVHPKELGTSKNPSHGESAESFPSFVTKILRIGLTIRADFCLD